MSERSAVLVLYFAALLLPSGGGVMEFDCDPCGRRLREPLFPLGRVVATPGALHALEDHGVDPASLLDRHVRGDWGDVPIEDARENALSVVQDYRILSSYRVGADRLWVITEGDRSVTTLLRPDEY